MMRQGGLSLQDVFGQVRLRVNEQTKGAEVPWDAGTLASRIELFERQANAPPPPQAYQQEGEVPAARSLPSVPAMPISPPSTAIPSRVTLISSRPIPTTRWRRACA